MASRRMRPAVEPVAVVAALFHVGPHLLAGDRLVAPVAGEADLLADLDPAVGLDDDLAAAGETPCSRVMAELADVTPSCRTRTAVVG